MSTSMKSARSGVSTPAEYAALQFNQADKLE
jgi:hypothetical protein